MVNRIKLTILRISAMKLILLVQVILWHRALAKTNFTDGSGAMHLIPNDATIVCGAMDAVALYHFGMNPDRVLATFGERSSSGSNYGKTYYDGNIAFTDLNHSMSDHDPTLFPADPNEEERAFLNKITGDLSPCSDSNYYCDKIEMDFLNENGWPDVIVVGGFYSSLMNKEFVGNATEKNIPIINMEDTYTDGEELHDFLWLAERMEELALALGVHEPDTVDEDKRALCKSAMTFQEVSKGAHEKGIRAMAAYMPYQEQEQGVVGAFIASPHQDNVLYMLHNLGMPILKSESIDSAWENRAGNYSPGGGDFLANNTMSVSGNASYYVDMWLYDDRVTLDFVSEEFAAHWPHPAILAKQYSHYPSNGRIISYRHAIEIMDIIGSGLANAEVLTSSSNCIDLAGGNVEDLKAGEYACYDPAPINFCADFSVDAKSSEGDESGSHVINTNVFVITTLLLGGRIAL